MHCIFCKGSGSLIGACPVCRGSGLMPPSHGDTDDLRPEYVNGLPSEPSSQGMSVQITAGSDGTRPMTTLSR
jgi:hypothetical protein